MSEFDDAQKALKNLGKQILDSLREGEFPTLELPDRTTGNIVFDKTKGQFVLGDSRITRDSKNIKHIKSFSQLMWVAAFAKKLLSAQRTSSLRDLYYSSEGEGINFSSQSESDRIVADLESLTGMAREDFGIFPEEHSSIYGRVTMEYTVPGYEGREVDLTISPDGLPVGPALMTAEPLETEAELILALESGGMFSRLIETRAWEKFNAVLVQLGGQPPRSTRRLMKRLHETLGLPLYIFTDGDPWGLHIARVIICGSASSAHIRGLTIPEAHWIGVTASDIVNYDLSTESMTDADMKRLDELKRDVRYADSKWQAYIDDFKDLRKKAEQQAFSRHGMDYVVDVYLPDKIA
ncbi:MAG: DNA topoisomerase IV subunit A [Candidatus Thorarchaeota archaeon]|nr:DNA topoisomerase IV subunit A [Candidatus Thorarchaeota archaeon]